MPLGGGLTVGLRNHALDGVKIGRIYSLLRGGDKSVMLPFAKLLRTLVECWYQRAE